MAGLITETQKQGSLESALAGDYDFPVGEILSEAWQCIDGYKMPFAIVSTVYFLFYILAMALVFLIWGKDSPVTQVVSNLVSLLMMPMGAALLMTGINMASGRPINVAMLFSYYDRALPLVGMQVVITIAILVGFLLLVIPGVYLSIALCFAIPLMLDRDLAITEAFETSRKAVTHRWFKVFGVMLAMGLIVFLSALPLGIGLFWTMPMMMAVNGVMYRRIFGINAGMDPGTQFA